MSRVYNDYYFEKQDILDTLEKLDMSVRLLNVWVNEPMGFENAKYLLEKSREDNKTLLFKAETDRLRLARSSSDDSDDEKDDHQ